jgi:beta-glucosidase
MLHSAGQVPFTYNHPPSGGRSSGYGDYTDLPAGPLFAFGHGMSYTAFDYSGLRIAPENVAAGETVDISLSVKNTGGRAGDEVVQLYVSDEGASVPRPVQELKGFCRVALGPGESRTVTFRLPVNLLAFPGADAAFRIEPGPVQILVGGSSADVRLRGRLTIEGDLPVKIPQRALDCPATVE